MSKLEELLRSLKPLPTSLESLLSDNEESKGEIDDIDNDGMTLEEMKEVWGVDFSDHELDFDDIPGAR